MVDHKMQVKIKVSLARAARARIAVAAVAHDSHARRTHRGTSLPESSHHAHCGLLAQGPFLVPPASHEDEVPLFASYGIGIGAGIVLLWFVWVMFAICCPDDRPLVGRTLATCCNQCEWNYVIVALLLVNPELLAEPIKYIGKGGG